MTPKWKFCFKIHIVVIFPSLPPYFSALSSILPSLAQAAIGKHGFPKETFFRNKNIFLMKTWSSQGHENSSLPSGHCKGQIAVAWGSES